MTEASTDRGGPADEAKPALTSKLKEGRQRFLATVIEHSLAIGRRNAQDFLRHFPPTAIMKGLEHNADLRSNILIMTTGVKAKIALKKDWESAAADLQIALDEGETDAESVVVLLDPDDRVRYLDARQLWSFVIEGDFWKGRSGRPEDLELARCHVAFMLERALQERLLTHKEVVEGVSVDELATRLPKAELGRIIQGALNNAGKSTPFTEVDLLATVPPSLLTTYLPLTHLWEHVVVPKIAQRHGFVEAPAPAPERSVKESPRKEQQEPTGGESKGAVTAALVAEGVSSSIGEEGASDAAQPASSGAAAPVAAVPREDASVAAVPDPTPAAAPVGAGMPTPATPGAGARSADGSASGAGLSAAVARARTVAAAVARNRVGVSPAARPVLHKTAPRVEGPRSEDDLEIIEEDIQSVTPPGMPVANASAVGRK